MGSGRISLSIQYFIQCGLCDNFVDFDEYKNKSEAIKYFKSLGWKKKNGLWICPQKHNESNA